jgi:hypothetical protein
MTLWLPQRLPQTRIPQHKVDKNANRGTSYNKRGNTMDKDEQIFRLWKLLDDIDTLDDAVKDNDKAFREHARTIQQKRRGIVPEAEVDKLYDRFYGKV